MGAEMSPVAVRRALVSVWDKTGLVDFVSRLVEAGVEVVSSGGTAAVLEDAGLAVTSVESVTGAPEMLGGRVKTLHPKIHGGILADTTLDAHVEDLEAQGVTPFDLVVVNLYPFEAVVAHPAVTREEAIETMDIGGPAMIRAAAKNHDRVGVVVDPSQYDEVGAAVEAGGIGPDLRRRLARKAFFRTASYDAAIVEWLERGPGLPERIVVPLRKHVDLRYGENPHQEGAAYAAVREPAWWVDAGQLQGKQMSFNNYLDSEAAWRLVHDFDAPAAAIVKHANPAGLALDDTVSRAFSAAWACDPLAAFGGVIAINRPLDAETAAGIAAAGFVEVVVAPSIGEDAAALLAEKQDLRLITASAPAPDDPDFRRIEGGFVLQARDRRAGAGEWRVASARAPEDDEAENMAFAWTAVRHTKSNAIVVANGLAAVGVGAGDQSRVGAAERAVLKAGDRAKGAVAASDAFFPFRDGIDVLAGAGVTAIIQPGGSVRDQEVIAAADELGLAMIFTSRRHFRH